MLHTDTLGGEIALKNALDRHTYMLISTVIHNMGWYTFVYVACTLKYTQALFLTYKSIR